MGDTVLTLIQSTIMTVSQMWMNLFLKTDPNKNIIF